jgi:tetratricopeptide (TPR) repeat protein
MEVKAWQQTVRIPTYGIGQPEKHPVFLEKRVYQGSSGTVYPYPVVEKILDEKTDQEWQAVFLENDYLLIMILPELGGRIQKAYDKVRQRHFVYHNQVIKPALVGLTGPWISGGIEFNWPQHHRPGTYEPVDWTIEHFPDGSVTVWCSELERMFRTKGMAGFTLHPDKAYLEIKVQLYNRTPLPQTFLWWANPAVHVNEHYQSVFPPDVHAVFDHGKRDVSRFPVATGTYYKVDYSAGVDISRYRNIPVPTSYMAITSSYDFVGGYEHDTQGGLLHVANHHVSPGKKQWTWGNSDFGQAWDRNLTDADGPYIELMCGVYTDNQPDFSWLMPYEEKSFQQYFMPYSRVGMVKNATKDLVLNLELHEHNATFKLYSTGRFPQSRAVLYYQDAEIWSRVMDLEPAGYEETAIQLHHDGAATDYRICIYDQQGRLMLQWQPEPDTVKPMPLPAKAAQAPAEIAQVEQLYLTGLHLEQYRHATYDPVAYYQEGLRRDPGDVRCNNALGKWYLRRLLLSEAESCFRSAIDTLTARNPNPYDGEPYYNLGLSLRWQQRIPGAYAAFHKSVWNAAWQASGYYQLALISAMRQHWEVALDEATRSLHANWRHHKTRHLLIAILRRQGNSSAALEWANASLQLDIFNAGAHFEKYLLTKDESVLEEWQRLLRGNIHNYIEYALDYQAAGMYPEALQLLQYGIAQQKEVYPLAWYFMAAITWEAGDELAAHGYWKKAALAAPDYCFPHQQEAALALQLAMQQHPEDARAPYYLGNYWYHFRQYEQAIACWERSRQLDDRFPTVHRNLALALFNKKQQPAAAAASLEKAFALDETDARILMELDQLYKRLNKPAQFRLELLEKYPALVNDRDDLYLERITLYNLLGRHQEAYELLCGRNFHPWEGGEGKVTFQYVYSLISLAKAAIMVADFQGALELLEKARQYPHNLGEGKLYGAQENDIEYWSGCAYAGLGQKANAIACWERAAAGQSVPAAAMYYNDQQPDKIFYQGLALLRLDRKAEAGSRFNKLTDYGEAHLFDDVKIDYFAVSLPDLLIWDDDLNRRNRLHCYYLIGLGQLGLGKTGQARAMFEQVLEADAYHIGAHIHLAMAGSTMQLS